MALGAGYTLLIGLVPAPEPIVKAIQQIDVECTLEEASVLRIELGIAATTLGDWSILDLDPFRPLTPLQLRVQRGAGIPEALINAFVTEHRVTYAEGGGSKLQITALDATYAMNLQEKVKPWLNMPDSAIASVIFARAQDRSRASTRPRRCSPNPRERRSSAARTSASCAASRAGTASTATSSPSRSPDWTSATSTSGSWSVRRRPCSRSSSAPRRTSVTSASVTSSRARRPPLPPASTC